jgi:hypothetical protein
MALNGDGQLRDSMRRATAKASIESDMIVLR